MSVTPDEVRRIAHLARIAEPAERLETLTEQMNKILDWVDQLNEVDVSDAQPMTTPIAHALPMRDDAVTDGGVRDQILKNAPKAEEGFFVMPKSVE